MPWPRITIITPSFNQGEFLERTIQSVLSQGYPNLEYWVIDGGSTDHSVDIIRRYANQLAGWISEPDKGQTDALNKGLALATGDIVAYLNSDDAYAPGALRHIGQLMAGDQAPAWVVGGCERIDAEDQPLDRFDVHAPHSFLAYLERASGLLTQPSSFWRRDLFERHGLFDRDLHFSFDYAFNARLLAGGERPTLTDQVLALFRVHDASKGETQAIRFGLERIEVARRHLPSLSWPDRLKLMRNLGYRRRRYAIQQAALDGGSLWPQVRRRPWWLASQEVRGALAGRRAA